MIGECGDTIAIATTVLDCWKEIDHKDAHEGLTTGTDGRKVVATWTNDRPSTALEKEQHGKP